ncbi:hypothetical protein CBL_01125 [Carabus blaptoides fortunei]
MCMSKTLGGRIAKYAVRAISQYTGKLKPVPICLDSDYLLTDFLASLFILLYSSGANDMVRSKVKTTRHEKVKDTYRKANDVTIDIVQVQPIAIRHLIDMFTGGQIRLDRHHRCLLAPVQHPTSTTLPVTCTTDLTGRPTIDFQ